MCLKLASGPAMKSYGRESLDALLAGVTLHYAKPLLLSEVRRIIPTSVGLPMELSLYTTAVAAASAECKLHLCSLNVPDFTKFQTIKTNAQNVFSQSKQPCHPHCLLTIKLPSS